MDDLLAMLDRAAAHPVVYGLHTYRECAAFVQGYDLARDGAVLSGFREWLIVRAGDGNNLSWSVLALRVAFPDRADMHDEAALADHGAAIAGLAGLLREFSSEREQRGLPALFVAYQGWLEAQPWYRSGTR